MHIQFPIKHNTPRCHWSIPNSIKPDINHPAGSGWPLALISLFAAKSDSLYPIKAGPRKRTINMAPKTHMSVPPIFAWPSVLRRFTVSVLHKKDLRIILNQQLQCQTSTHACREREREAGSRKLEGRNLSTDPIVTANMKVKTGIAGWIAAA